MPRLVVALLVIAACGRDGFDPTGDATAIDGASPVTYAATVLADHPVGYWRLDEAQGATTAADISGGDHTAIYSAVITLGQMGALHDDADTAALVDGEMGCIIAGADPAFDFSGNLPYSVEVWAQDSEPADGQYRHPFFHSNSTLVSDYGLFLNATEGLGFERIISSSRMLVSVPPPDLTSFRYLVGTYDGATLVLYVDSIAVATISDARVMPDLDGPLHIGCRPLVGGTLLAFAGTLDEAAIYDVALTPMQIRTHWRVGSGN